MFKLILNHPAQEPLSLDLIGSLNLGRSDDCELCLPDSNLSRRHCRIELDADGWIVRDLASRNGTFINGARIQKHRLRPNDLLQAGAVSICFKESSMQLGMPCQAEDQLLQFLLPNGHMLDDSFVAAPAIPNHAAAQEPIANDSAARKHKPDDPVACPAPHSDFNAAIAAWEAANNLVSHGKRSSSSGRAAIVIGHTAQDDERPKWGQPIRRNRTWAAALAIVVSLVALVEVVHVRGMPPERGAKGITVQLPGD